MVLSDTIVLRSNNINKNMWFYALLQTGTLLYCVQQTTLYILCVTDVVRSLLLCWLLFSVVHYIVLILLTEISVNKPHTTHAGYFIFAQIILATHPAQV